MQKAPANELCLKISTEFEFTWKKNFLKMFCLMKHWLLNKRTEHTEQHQEHGTEGAGTAVPTWDSASTAVLPRKRGKQILETFVARWGKEPWILEVNLWQICRSGVLLNEWTRSWALLGLLSTIWPPDILTVLMYSLSPKSLLLSLKANLVTSCQYTGSKMM